MNKQVIALTDQMLITTDLLANFGEFLRLHVADGDANENTIRSYYGNAAQYVSWCTEHSIDQTRAAEADLISFRQWLSECYGRGTVAVKLASVKRLYEAATWHGLRPLLAAPQGDRPAAIRDRAILALMGRHGLRVSEVAGLSVADVLLDAGTVQVLGKGEKERTVYLTETTAGLLRDWLSVRLQVAHSGEAALFVALDRRSRGHSTTARAIRWKVDRYLEHLASRRKASLATVCATARRPGHEQAARPWTRLAGCWGTAR